MTMANLSHITPVPRSVAGLRGNEPSFSRAAPLLPVRKAVQPRWL
jgi:hypothetical protein